MRKTFVLIIVALLFGSHLFAEEEARNALLIANGEYENIPSLSRPVKEGMDLKEALESIGFEVTFIQNADLAEMVKALSEFENKVKNNNGIALFHYGGHAIQFNKENYLIPVDAKTEYEMIAYTCVNVDEAVMKRMAGEANIVVLDSCRNDPFEEYMTDTERRSVSASRGLAAVKLKSKNSIIIYSAQAGHEAQDGIFTPVFTEKITEKGKSLSDVITETSDSVAQLTMNEQVPAVYGRLMSIYLAGETAVSYDLKKTVATGSISITSEFAGKIYLDGNYQSDISAFETVVLEDVATARYKLEIRGEEANESQTQYTVVKRDEESSISFKVSTGNISIVSEFAGDIYLNSKKTGSIQANKIFHIESIKPGSYKVEIQGKETQTRTITVVPKETVDISFRKTQKIKPARKPRKFLEFKESQIHRSGIAISFFDVSYCRNTGGLGAGAWPIMGFWGSFSNFFIGVSLEGFNFSETVGICSSFVGFAGLNYTVADFMNFYLLGGYGIGVMWEEGDARIIRAGLGVDLILESGFTWTFEYSLDFYTDIGFMDRYFVGFGWRF